jgi:antirestriction protein ArdC
MTTCTARDNAQSDQSPKQDVYGSITAKIVAALEDGVRPWVRPWNAEHAAGRIMRPLRHNGQPYSGINILSLWASASVQGFAAPIWMTYRQAVQLGAHVRKGEKGSPVVYANSITRNEADTDSGVEVARDIHFLKGYTVFNVEQIEGLPAAYWRRRHRASTCPPASPGANAFRRDRCHARPRRQLALYRPRLTARAAALRDLPRRRELLRHPRARERRTGPHNRIAWRATSAPNVSGPKATRSKNSWPNSAPRSSVPTLI